MLLKIKHFSENPLLSHHWEIDGTNLKTLFSEIFDTDSLRPAICSWRSNRRSINREIALRFPYLQITCLHFLLQRNEQIAGVEGKTAATPGNGFDFHSSESKSNSDDAKVWRDHRPTKINLDNLKKANVLWKK